MGAEIFVENLRLNVWRRFVAKRCPNHRCLWKYVYFCTLNLENKSKMNKKLYRSMADKKLCGVCGGLGEYFDVDPTLIRLLWIIFTFMGGAGLLAYIICAIIVPQQGQLPNP